jgi:DNA primase
VARISEETVQRVAEANDIVEVIGSYFPLKRAGASWRALCPFHREKTPSFHVNPQRQSYHCFGCGAGGTVFRFVMDYEHVDFPSAVRRLAQRAGIPVVEEAGSVAEDHRHALRKRLLALHAEAAAWFHENLFKAPAAQSARAYLTSRGISTEIARSWQLGYAPESRDSLLEYLRGKQFSIEEITQGGLASPREDERDQSSASAIQRLFPRFRGRVMFPIRNDYGEVIAFSGRVLDPDAKAAKYVNSPETPLFTKGRVLYGLDKSKRALIEANAAIVCEGQIDLISAFEAGVQNVIAPQGTAFTPEQARLLRRFVESVILCFDSDQAGQKAIGRSLPALLECGLEVRVASLPEGEDPDSLIRAKGVDRFREIINGAPGFFEHALQHLAQRGNLDDPSAKAAAARRLGPYVAAIKDPVLREATTKRICRRLGITETSFSPHLKSSQIASAPEVTETAQSSPIPLTEGFRQLCRLALMHPESRGWLASQLPLPRDLMDQGGKLLVTILRSPLPLENPASLATFISRLDKAEEVTLAQLDLSRMPADPLRLAKEHWNGLFAQQLQEKNLQAKAFLEDRTHSGKTSAINLQILQDNIERAKSRLQDTSLETSERKGLEEVVGNLTKQILDLQSRLNEL